METMSPFLWPHTKSVPAGFATVSYCPVSHFSFLVSSLVPSIQPGVHQTGVAPEGVKGPGLCCRGRAVLCLAQTWQRAVRASPHASCRVTPKARGSVPRVQRRKARPGEAVPYHSRHAAEQGSEPKACDLLIAHTYLG